LRQVVLVDGQRFQGSLLWGEGISHRPGGAKFLRAQFSTGRCERVLEYVAVEWGRRSSARFSKG
jgi:hypothetical protein